MKYGLNTLLWTSSFNQDHLGLLPQIKAWGFDAIEIARFDFDNFPARLVREAAHNEGLDVVLCSALTGNLSLAAPDTATRIAAVDFLRRAIENAAELGAETLVGPFVSAIGLFTGTRATADEWRRVDEELRLLAPALRACDVTLAIEPLNRFETYLLTTAAQAAALCTRLHDPYIGVLYDTFHANIEEKDPPDALLQLGSYVAHVHVCENDRGTPGTGHIDWPATFQALHDIQYRGCCVIESFGSNVEEIAAAARVWRDFAPSSEDLARQGLAFLKSVEARPLTATA